MFFIRRKGTSRRKLFILYSFRKKNGFGVGWWRDFTVCPYYSGINKNENININGKGYPFGILYKKNIMMLRKRMTISHVHIIITEGSRQQKRDPSFVVYSLSFRVFFFKIFFLENGVQYVIAYFSIPFFISFIPSCLCITSSYLLGSHWILSCHITSNETNNRRDVFKRRF